MVSTEYILEYKPRLRKFQKLKLPLNTLRRKKLLQIHCKIPSFGALKQFFHLGFVSFFLLLFLRLILPYRLRGWGANFQKGVSECSNLSSFVAFALFLSNALLLCSAQFGFCFLFKREPNKEGTFYPYSYPSKGKGRVGF